jgi:hypothetical protein
MYDVAIEGAQTLGRCKELRLLCDYLQHVLPGAHDPPREKNPGTSVSKISIPEHTVLLEGGNIVT